MIENQVPFSVCEDLPNLGGFWRLRLAYSKDIIQQRYQTDTELSEIIFLKSQNYVGDWQYKDRFTGELKIENSMADFGLEEKYSFKAVLEVDCEPTIFRNWYKRTIELRRLALELTNNNGFVRVMNPFVMTYTYIGAANFENLNRYELTFTRVSLVDNLKGLENNVIDSVDVACDVEFVNTMTA